MVPDQPTGKPWNLPQWKTKIHSLPFSPTDSLAINLFLCSLSLQNFLKDFSVLTISFPYLLVTLQPTQKMPYDTVPLRKAPIQNLPVKWPQPKPVVTSLAPHLNQLLSSSQHFALGFQDSSLRRYVLTSLTALGSSSLFSLSSASSSSKFLSTSRLIQEPYAFFPPVIPSSPIGSNSMLTTTSWVCNDHFSFYYSNQLELTPAHHWIGFRFLSPYHPSSTLCHYENIQTQIHQHFFHY